MSDFNGRAVEERLFVDDPEIRFSLDLFLQEIDILFSTEKTTIMGFRKFGLSLEHLLWKTNSNATYLESQIKDQINKYCESGLDFRWTVRVQLMPGATRDIGVITIHIKDNQDTDVATQKFIFK